MADQAQKRDAEQGVRSATQGCSAFGSLTLASITPGAADTGPRCGPISCIVSTFSDYCHGTLIVARTAAGIDPEINFMGFVGNTKGAHANLSDAKMRAMIGRRTGTAVSEHD